MRRVAVIDIGTVTCRLAVADVADNKIMRMIKNSTICNLGEGLAQSGRLSSAAIARVEACCKEYIRLALAAGARQIATTLTEAARAAKNGNQLLMRLSGLGLKPQIIDGKTEGSLTFLGVAQDAIGKRILVADNGGGSTELTLGSYSGNKLEIEQVISTKLGCRTLSELYSLTAKGDYVPTQEAISSAKEQIEEGFAATFLSDIPKEELQELTLYICGGTATSLSAILQKLKTYDPSKIHLSKLEAHATAKLADDMSYMSEVDLLELPCLQPQRAPVILAGSLIVSTLIQTAMQNAAYVSESDLLVGLSLAAAAAAKGPTDYMPYTPRLAHFN